MDKEKKIEEMATVLPKVIVYDGSYGWDDEQEVDCRETARNLNNAGYGNIEQAIREFAEKFCDLLWIKCGIYKAHSQRLAQEVMKVLYGN